MKTLILLFWGILLMAGCAVDRSPADVNAGQRQTETVMRTGVLEAQPGYTGSKFGVEVESVSNISDEVQAVDLVLPFTAEQVDLIEVETVNGEVVDLPKEVDIESGPDPNNTGIRVYLPKRKNWEFRIRIIDTPEDG